MKVVLFCGGQGLRLHPSTERIPKPLVQVGGKPILLLLMKYYSFFGHRDFILCLGYKGEEIKKFFLNYDECLSGDFVLSNGNKRQKLFKSDIENWKITFAETGLNSNLGERLKAVQKYLDGEEIFLANYADGITDMHLPTMIDFFIKQRKVGCLITVKPSVVFHYVSANKDNYVKEICQLNKTPLRINGGFFIFRRNIFDYIKPGEDLVNEPFQRLIEERELVAYKYDGFWASLDTYKDKQRLDELASKNASFWEIWNHRKSMPSDK
ncbi:MAG: sugar phosphate nucleotidyltransferase [Ignavibacteriaceae bacterium]